MDAWVRASIIYCRSPPRGDFLSFVRILLHSPEHLIHYRRIAPFARQSLIPGLANQSPSRLPPIEILYPPPHPPRECTRRRCRGADASEREPDEVGLPVPDGRRHPVHQADGTNEGLLGATEGGAGRSEHEHLRQLGDRQIVSPAPEQRPRKETDKNARKATAAVVDVVRGDGVAAVPALAGLKDGQVVWVGPQIWLTTPTQLEAATGAVSSLLCGPQSAIILPYPHHCLPFQGKAHRAHSGNRYRS